MAALRLRPDGQPKVGKRSREWTAIAPTQAHVVREMARCLREIAARKVAKSSEAHAGAVAKAKALGVDLIETPRVA